MADTAETNIADLLIKRMETAPEEFFKAGAGAFSQTVARFGGGGKSRVNPPYLLPRWSRVFTLARYSLSEADWDRLEAVAQAMVLQLAEAEFYNNVAPVPDDSAQTQTQTQTQTPPAQLAAHSLTELQQMHATQARMKAAADSLRRRSPFATEYLLGSNISPPVNDGILDTLLGKLKGKNNGA